MFSTGTCASLFKNAQQLQPYGDDDNNAFCKPYELPQHEGAAAVAAFLTSNGYAAMAGAAVVAVTVLWRLQTPRW